MNIKNKILLVDDEPDILEFLSYNLIKEGYLLETASNGKEAIAIAKAYIPDLVILDIMMPEMDGIEVCRHLRAIKELKHSLIAFLTARGEEFTQIAALDSGGDDFIQKPIRPSLLISRVKALLRRSNTNELLPATPIKLGDIELDFEKFLVTKGGKTIHLARKEFELLAMLVGKPGKVFRRNEILNQVWGTDVIVGTRTIDVHIRKLREKLGDSMIKTIKGVGYKIDY